MALTQQAFEGALVAHTHTGLGVTPSFEVGIAVAVKQIKQLVQDYPSHIATLFFGLTLK